MRALALLVAILAAGCLRTAAYSCEQPTDCVRGGVQGSCESTGYCSFPDSSCASGYRYGDLSASYSNKCVDDGTTNDGGPDAPLPDDDDDDNDGVLDVSDNCPLVSNAMQHNEDGDAFGDECDPCPPFANNADGDGDKVGDQCDPNPGTAGDSILAFEGFQGGIPAGADMSGTFTAAGGNLTSPATGGWRLTIPVPASATTGKETVMASVTLMAAGGTLQAVGVLHHNAAGMTTGVSCSPFNAGGTPGISVANIAMLSDQSNANFEFMVGQTYRVELSRNQDAYTCRATRGAAMGSVNRNFTINPAMPYFGVVGSNATGRYAWVMLLRSP